jgi:hypothetical protein
MAKVPIQNLIHPGEQEVWKNVGKNAYLIIKEVKSLEVNQNEWKINQRLDCEI